MTCSFSPWSGRASAPCGCVERHPSCAASRPPAQARGDMVWEERMAEAARYRDAGNAHFRADRVEEAQTEYQAVRAGPMRARAAAWRR